jgi:DNA-binding beta-propeller fold protein YncE
MPRAFGSPPAPRSSLGSDDERGYWTFGASRDSRLAGGRLDLVGRVGRTEGMDRRGFLCAATALMLTPDAFARSLGGTPVALVTADLESRIVAVELKNGRRLATIRTLPGPRSIQTVGNAAVVAHTAEGALTIVDGGTLAIRRVLRGFSEPRYAAGSPEGRYAYVTDSGFGGFVVVDVVRGRVVGRIQLGGPARHVSIDPSGRLLWTALGTKADRIAIVDVRTPEQPRLLARIRPAFLAHDVGFAPGGKLIWLTSGDRREAAIFDRRTGRAVVRMRAGAPPQHVTFAGGRAFVTSGDDGTLRIHSAITGRVLGGSEIPTGSYNVQEGWGRILTPSLSRGTLCILDSSGRRLRRLDLARSSHDACFVMAA